MNMTQQQHHLIIKATESLIKAEHLVDEIKLILRQSAPNRLDLAIVRANCSDINRVLEDVNYWAAVTYRAEEN